MEKLKVLVAMLCASLGMLAQEPDPGQSIGLVLSGGGSKGIAHIGLIQALEDNDIPIDYITGTSMGAIVGGLYAAGYTPQEMLDIILSDAFSYWSTGQIDPSLTYYFSTQGPTPTMVSLPLGISKKDSIMEARTPVYASLISPMPMNFAVMDLFAAQTAQCGGDFDKLFVPFRCVASDVNARHKVVLSHGDLGYSIRSSMSFPIVFQPTHVDSMYLYDGGVYDNFPVGVMMDTFSPDFILGINVSSEAIGPQTSIFDQLENLVIQNNDYYLDPRIGMKIRYHLNEFGLLDFPKAKQIYKIGYDVAMQYMDSIKSRIHSRVPKEERELRRRVFKSQTPYLRFDSVEVSGASKKQNEYIRYLFTHNRRDTIGMDRARHAYYRAISPGMLRDLVPHAYYNDSTGLFKLTLEAAPKDNFKIGLGAYITSSTQNYLYLSGNYTTMSFKSIAANFGVWLGQSYLGGNLNARLYLPTHVPSAVELEAVAFRQKYYSENYLFFEDKAPSYILDHEYFVRLKWAWAIGSLCDMESGLGYGHLYDSFYQPDTQLGYLSARDKCKFDLGQLYLRFETNTLDDMNFPTQGRLYQLTSMGVYGNFKHTRGTPEGQDNHAKPKWLQLESISRLFWTSGRHFSFGLESDIILSTRKLLTDYNATMVTAPAFQPTPSSYNSFNKAFRANSFISIGITPIYKYNSSLNFRWSSYCFLPLRKIVEDPHGGATYAHGWLNHPEYFGEIDVCYKLPFGTVTGYLNYASTAHDQWNVGLSFGIFMPAPRFLR